MEWGGVDAPADLPTARVKVPQARQHRMAPMLTSGFEGGVAVAANERIYRDLCDPFRDSCGLLGCEHRGREGAFMCTFAWLRPRAYYVFHRNFSSHP